MTFHSKSPAALVAAYEESSGLTIEMNEVDHNTFQENINNYLQEPGRRVRLVRRLPDAILR